jgi:hypothetical protein
MRLKMALDTHIAILQNGANGGTDDGHMDASLEEMKARADVFEENLDAAGKAGLGKTQANVETGHEPREAEGKTDLKEMDTTGMEANREKSEAVAEREVTNGKYRSTGGPIHGPGTDRRIPQGRCCTRSP